MTLSIFSTTNGQLVQQSFTAPSAVKVASLTVTARNGQPYFVGDPATFSGTMVDMGGCAVETGPITQGR